MANTLVLLGIVIAIGGKLVAVGYFVRVEQARTMPFLALILGGYLMVVAGGLSGGGLPF